MNPLSALVSLPASEKLERGLAHTPHEIAQQPETWLQTFAQVSARQQEVREFLTAAGVFGPAEKRPMVFLVGAGTSDYIGWSLHHLLRRQWQCEVIPVGSTSLLPDFQDYVLPEQRALWISFSRSGDSPEGVAVLERALAECPQIAHLLVTCNASSRMTQAIEGHSNAYAVVLDDATNDRGLAMTSSFTNMVLAGQMLAHTNSLDALEPVVHALAEAGKSLLPRAARLAADLVKRDYTRAAVVGSATLAGAAMESALKLLELTAGNVQAFALPTLALRHGPMAALDRDTLFISLLSTQPQRRKYELDLLREIGGKSLVRTRVAVTSDDAEALREEAEYILSPERPAAIPDLYRPVMDVLFGQLLGLFGSIHFGLKPDVPSPNGAISRVVQNVGIY